MCRICEVDFIIHSRYQNHMKVTHAAQDMPYSCQLCQYRSSVYNDVIAHFRKVICLSFPYCVIFRDYSLFFVPLMFTVYLCVTNLLEFFI